MVIMICVRCLIGERVILERTLVAAISLGPYRMRRRQLRCEDDHTRIIMIIRESWWSYKNHNDHMGIIMIIWESWELWWSLDDGYSYSYENGPGIELSLCDMKIILLTKMTHISHHISYIIYLIKSYHIWSYPMIISYNVWSSKLRWKLSSPTQMKMFIRFKMRKTIPTQMTLTAAAGSIPGKNHGLRLIMDAEVIFFFGSNNWLVLIIF